MPLPDFPCPTHHLAKGVRSFDLPTGEVLHRPVRVPPHELATRAEYAQYAPLRAVTVEDAIGDLVCALRLWYDVRFDVWRRQNSTGATRPF